MYLEISLILLSAAVCGMVLMVIPLAIQLNRFIKGLSQALEQINKDLPRILQNIEEISANTRTSSFLIRRRVETMDAALGKLQGYLGFFSSLEHIVRPFLKLPSFRLLNTAGALIKGLRAFLSVLFAKDMRR
ncbi:MAG: hypothetical protein N2572_08005 [Syntrophales bacterium]|nr:hypothetical protein [Syntrophales bacterium]